MGATERLPFFVAPSMGATFEVRASREKTCCNPRAAPWRSDPIRSDPAVVQVRARATWQRNSVTSRWRLALKASLPQAVMPWLVMSSAGTRSSP